jgi:uncharacterized protein YgbK (DUF1537 family)
VDAKQTQSRLTVLIGEVIRVTEEQYEKYRQKADNKLRKSSQKIINAALSFKDIISTVAASDTTQHAAAAWTIVLLGLTVCNAGRHIYEEYLTNSMTGKPS